MFIFVIGKNLDIIKFCLLLLLGCGIAIRRLLKTYGIITESAEFLWKSLKFGFIW